MVRKEGFERGVKKPHIALRKGFWYAFQNNQPRPHIKSSCPNLEWRWSWGTRGKDESIGSVAKRVCGRLDFNGCFSFCNTRNIQLRGLFK